MRRIAFIAAVIAAATQWPSSAVAQVQAQPHGPEAFESENAILDTALPFAIGAREAQQSLRSSFGWATFQEGLVEGVYFRFDPDGYARFSPTPRLDTDVFEVICRPRTYSCMGRKDIMSMVLTNRGQLQLKLENVSPDDTFFVSEGVSEIQLPNRILQPLDHQLEGLLSSGGELIVRRGEQTISNISLKGFSAVATYLRWVLARQDYTVLPRGWPVPNSKSATSDGAMTRPTTWVSPMPQPQMLSPNSYGTAGSGAVQPGARVQEEVAEVRGELKLMRELLLQSGRQPAGENGLIMEDNLPASAASDPLVNTRLEQLQAVAEEIREEIAQLQREEGRTNFPQPFERVVTSGSEGMERTRLPDTVANPFAGAQLAAITEQGGDRSESQFANHLAFLIEEVGLSPEVALTVLRNGKDGSTPAPQVPSATVGAVTQSNTRGNLYQGDVVSEILRELEQEFAVPASGSAPGAMQVNPEEFQLLSDYFRSVVLPEIQPN